MDLSTWWNDIGRWSPGVADPMRMNAGRVRTDKEGYLLDLSDWNANVALDTAATL